MIVKTTRVKELRGGEVGKHATTFQKHPAAYVLITKENSISSLRDVQTRLTPPQLAE